MFETLGHYKILDRIGAGGIGEVYRARDTRLGRTVAIKVVSTDIAADRDRRERFIQDARAASALSHPNIAALYEIGDDQGQLFAAFEYVPGETLKRVIAGRPLNPRRALDHAIQIADALADAHAAGIVHRDIRSGAVIITPKGNAKILDVGLAAWTDGGTRRDQAARAATVATVVADATSDTMAYLSPEQALGEPVDHRTDIFSLGIVLFEMLTGRLPFAGPTSTALALQVVQAPAPVPSTVNAALPKELDASVGKALAKSLDQRYESAATLAADLRAVRASLDVRSERQNASAAFIPARPARRSGIGWIVLLLLVLAGISAAEWFDSSPFHSRLRDVWRSTLGPPPAPLIAVVPVNTEAAQAFFADGLVDDLITQLGLTPGVTVLGRSWVRRVRGRAPTEVAREVGAAVALSASAQSSAEAVTLTLALIDPRTGAPRWTGQYTNDIKNVFALHAQAASAVAAALGITFQPTRAREVALSRLVEPRGYDAYLRGRQAASDRQWPEAIAHYETAVAADAGLGEAFAGLAEALYLQVLPAIALDDEAHRLRLQRAAQRAYELDPDLPAANLAMGLASDSLADALKHFRRAIELDPSYAAAYRLVGESVAPFDAEQGTAFLTKSGSLDPARESPHSSPAATRVAEPCTGARPGDIRCSLYTAAARKNGGQAAAMLDRIAANEPMLRAFAAGASDQPGMTWLDPRSQPWSLIAAQPQFVEAQKRLEAAFIREREIARAALKGLP